MIESLSQPFWIPDGRGTGTPSKQPTLEELSVVSRPFSEKVGLVAGQGFTIFNNTIGLGLIRDSEGLQYHPCVVWERNVQFFTVQDGRLLLQESEELIWNTYHTLELPYTEAAEMFFGNKYRVTIQPFTADGKIALTEVHTRVAIKPPDLTTVNSTMSVANHMNDVKFGKVRPSSLQ